jgi:hypothetical protein
MFRLSALSRVYTEFCETILEDVVNDPGNGFGDLRALDMLLLLADYHDYSVGFMDPKFWDSKGFFIFEHKNRFILIF